MSWLSICSVWLAGQSGDCVVRWLIGSRKTETSYDKVGPDLQIQKIVLSGPAGPKFVANNYNLQCQLGGKVVECLRCRLFNRLFFIFIESILSSQPSTWPNLPPATRITKNTFKVSVLYISKASPNPQRPSDTSHYRIHHSTKRIGALTMLKIHRIPPLAFFSAS